VADALAAHTEIANKVNVELDIEVNFVLNVTLIVVKRWRKNVVSIFGRNKFLGTNSSLSCDKEVVCMARFVPALCLKCANRTCLCNCIDSSLLRAVGKGAQIKPGK